MRVRVERDQTLVPYSTFAKKRRPFFLYDFYFYLFCFFFLTIIGTQGGANMASFIPSLQQLIPRLSQRRL